jgi:hypothetical protein
VLRSQTTYPQSVADEFGQTSGELRATALDAFYRHDASDWMWFVGYSDLPEEFRADLGFVPRVDIRELVAGVGYTVWGEEDDWYTRLFFRASSSRTEDHAGRLAGESHRLLFRGWGPLQTFLILELMSNRERFAERVYEANRQYLFFNIRPTGDFTCSIKVHTGDVIDYDNARPARRFRLGPGLTYNIGRHVFVQLDHDFEEVEVHGGRLYRANLTRLRLLYHFNRRCFIRAIVHATRIERTPELYLSEVEPESDVVFTQLLFSYKVNPQTLVFLGYSDNRLGDHEWDLTRTNHTVFLKLGYVWVW